jgi:TetR/AcrR family transcriptional regulator, transcriptional repressor for nem operon
MDLAEARIRDAGYGGFSFRDLAAEMGIKSASVHHHFATKASLTAAVARRYRERFFLAVARQPGETAAEAIAVYRRVFREALNPTNRMCLYGVLSAEAGALAPELAGEVATFFRSCVIDLSERIGGPGAEARAYNVIATLEGAMMLARSYDNIEAFDQATASLA